MLTIKSDDVSGRTKAYEAIVKNEDILQPSVPESFKVLVKELQSLGLAIEVINEEDRASFVRGDTEIPQLKVGAEGEEIITAETEEGPGLETEPEAEEAATEAPTLEVTSEVEGGEEVATIETTETPVLEVEPEVEEEMIAKAPTPEEIEPESGSELTGEVEEENA